ncbi:MAG: sensor histidine kinase [Clostridia bacterium]|nr:sensor histidine kinase [Clostridia bacterium]
MQIYLYRALTTFLFPLGLIAGSFIFIRERKGWRRQMLVWPAGLLLSYLFCVLFQYLKDVALRFRSGSPKPGEYYVSLESYITNYLLNFGMKLLLFLFFLLLMRLAYGMDRKDAVFAGCTVMAGETLGTVCFEILAVRFGPDSVYILRIISASWTNFLAYLGLHAMVYFLCWWLFSKKLTHGYISEMPQHLLTVVMFITAAAIFSSCVSAPPTESEYMAHIVLEVTQMILCLTILLLEYYIVSWFHSQFEQTQLTALMKYQEKHYEVTRERMEIVNQNAHDMKYKLRSLMQELNEGENTHISDELSSMREAIRAWDALYHTGNKALDVVLSEKATLCNQESIQFSVIANGAGIAFMQDSDIYTLFGNALDNSIEAVRKVEEQSARLISFSLRTRSGFVLIHIENSFSGQVTFREGEPVTSKKDKAMHGFGIKSIKNISAKYGGRVKLGTRDQLFFLDIVLPERAV